MKGVFVMANFHEEDTIMSPKKKFDDIIQDINEEIEKAHRAGKLRPHHIDDREFKQFKKGWFYHNWYHRFRRLGSVGVIAIPNTSLEEWIYWLYEWSQAFVDDYNRFKDLVFEAIKLHEEHLAILDTKVEDLENRVQEIERQLVLIWEEIRKLTQEINNIKNEINSIHGDINNINNSITNINNRIDGLESEFDSFKANVFNVGFTHSFGGVTTNGWQKMSHPETGFGILWDWNNAQDHSQGIHWQLNINWIEIAELTPQKMVGQEIGYIDFPNDLDERIVNNFPSATWLYAGYIISGAGIASNLFIRTIKEGRRIKVNATNYTHTSESASYGKGQINNGGIPTNYILFD